MNIIFIFLYKVKKSVINRLIKKKKEKKKRRNMDLRIFTVKCTEKYEGLKQNVFHDTGSLVDYVNFGPLMLGNSKRGT